MRAPARVRPALTRTASAGEAAETTTAVSSGPVMNAVSTNTASSAKALCRRVASGIRFPHNVRMHAPSAGTVAPQTTPIAASAGGLAPAFAASTKAVMAGGFSAATGSSTRVCP